MKNLILTLLLFYIFCLQLVSQNIITPIKTYPAPLLAIDGQYGVWHKTTPKEDNALTRITRPFIICEGFDVANDIEFIDLYEQLNNNRQYEKHI